MLYAPHSMDSWTGKEVLEDEGNGGYRDATTGKPLSKKLAASYMAFCKRHSRRCHTGDMVDKYIRLVDKYQPRVFAESTHLPGPVPRASGGLTQANQEGPQTDPQSAGEKEKAATCSPKQLGGSCCTRDSSVRSTRWGSLP